MKQRLADYVADFIVEQGIRECFTVVGGGAMHLNDALGHKEGLHCTYNHHEQAAAIAAEAYARVSGGAALLCVTTGPGGTNSITGVLGAWLDSVPMFVLSGQVRHDTTARHMEQYTDGFSLRAVGDQEFDITKAVSCMCKYAVMLEDPMQIRRVLEEAYYWMSSGRKGPVWIDIPVDYQGCSIETEGLEGYNPTENKGMQTVSDEVVDQVLKKIEEAERPVLYAGHGIRLSGRYNEFRRAVEYLGIPVVTCFNSIDLLEDENPLYVGRGGMIGDRAGNFAVQNSDLVLSVGNRLSIRQVGYSWETWAREAYVIDVDIDPAELKKATAHIDMPICADAGEFLTKINSRLKNRGISHKHGWVGRCQAWKEKYPVTLPRHWEEDGKYANVYAFIKRLSENLPERSVTVVSNGSASVAGSQNYVIKRDSRFIINSAVASMGYGLPAAIGACIANDGQDVICIEGDGSIMMNLQEMQTVLTNQLPIKLFLINNEGYHSIRQTQNSLFRGHSKVGIGPESGDLSFPDFKKIAEAFGYLYLEAHSNSEMVKVVEQALKMGGPLFCEVFVSPSQVFEPKSATRKLEDGTLVSPPLEDLAPFLPREELRNNMLIDMVEYEKS